METNLHEIGGIMRPGITPFTHTIFLCVLLCGSWAWAAEPGVQLDLAPDELRFIKEHPVVSLGSATSFDPFISRNKDGTYSGIDIDITNLISERTGLKFRFTLGNWDNIVKRAENRELDGLTSSLPHPSRSKYFDFSIPYVTYSTVVIVKKGNPKGIHGPQDLDGKRAAVMTGNINSLNELRTTGADVEIVWEANLHDVIRSVALGRNDFMTLGESVFYTAAQLGLAGSIETAFPSGTITKLCYSLRNDRPELVSIIDKALKSIPQETMVAIRNRWIGGASWDPAVRGGEIVLSGAERAYLDLNNSLGVCVKGDDPPLSRFSSDGNLEGMAADFIRLSENALGPSVRLLPVRTRNPLLGLVENRCDLVMMSEIADTARGDVSYTTPYVSFPYVVVSTTDKPFQDEFHPEPGQVFAVVQGSNARSQIETAFPGTSLREVATIGEGLQGVRDGKFYGLIATSLAVTQQIQEKYITTLKILKQTPFTARFAVATKSSTPQLNHIFQKIVGHMTETEKRNIINKWVAVKFEKGIDYSLVWKILAGAAFLFAATIYWNTTLNRSKRRAEAALAAEREAVRANLNFIDMISHEYRSPLSVISSNLDLIEAKTSEGGGKDVSREVTRMRNSAKRLLNIFEKSMAGIRVESAGVAPNMQLVDLEAILHAALHDTRIAYPGRNIEIKLYHGPAILVLGDPELLNIGVLNILDNACKYSDEETQIIVTLGMEDGYAVLGVRDWGIGISDEDMKHIFEKYYRSQNVGKKRGIGVGLHLVKSIVDLHDGRIRVLSRQGEGTSMEIRLPLVKQP